jgi:hypothetical protein
VAAMNALASTGDPYDAPVISCAGSTQTSITLQICGGATTGAPAGVSIQYKTCAQYAASLAASGDGWADDGTLCALSLSGMPGRDHGAPNSRWDLDPGACQSIQIDASTVDREGPSGGASTTCPNDLQCGTCYVFRAFAHADRNGKRSAFTANLECSTAECNGGGGGCTHTQGYWGTHGPVDGDCHNGHNADAWPVHTLTMGGISYDATQICAILNLSPPNCNAQDGANAVIILQHQLIAALFSVASGASDACVANAIADAQAELTQNSGCVGASTTLGQQMTATSAILDQYNQGQLPCAQHCDDLSGSGSGLNQRAVPVQQGQPTIKRSWGELKVIYR